MGKLYYGDNLDVMRKYVKDETVDLVYLDPPFNSQANYNVLFREKSGAQSASQISAFSDFWEWDLTAMETLNSLLEDQKIPERVTRTINNMVLTLGRNAMSAYLVMMTARFLELRRVMKRTGSIYLHCDPTASHYLKVVMDSIFGNENFVNEIDWKRSAAHSDAKQGSKHYGRIHDILLFYSKSENYTWNQQYTPHDPDYVNEFYKHVDEDSGRRYQLTDLTGPGGEAKGNPKYELMGVTRYWRYSKENMDDLVRQGRIVQTSPGAVPRYKRYLDEMPGVPLQDMWADIHPVSSQSYERLGFPTQKPVALLERIIQVSSNKGDIVLDPFCGCGTTIHAAQKLGREWIGIDITHLAINLIKNRLTDAFHLAPEIYGEPQDLESAKALALQNRYQFQWWALSLIGGRPVGNEKKKGADRGIDGVLYNHSGDKLFTGIVQVKSGHVKSGDVRDLRGVMERENSDYAIFITLEEPTDEMRKESLAAGFLKTAWGENMPKIQIATIEGLLSGEKPDQPSPPGVFERAQKERTAPKKTGADTSLESL